MTLIPALQVAEAYIQEAGETDVMINSANVVLNRWVIIRGVRRGFVRTYAVMMGANGPVGVCEIIGAAQSSDEWAAHTASEMHEAGRMSIVELETT